MAKVHLVRGVPTIALEPDQVRQLAESFRRACDLVGDELSFASRRRLAQITIALARLKMLDRSNADLFTVALFQAEHDMLLSDSERVQEMLQDLAPENVERRTG